MKQILLSVFVALSISTFVFGQTDTSKSGNTVIYFGSGGESKSYVYDGQAIKLGVFDFASGLYGLHYEREINELFSGQIGFGVTSKNPIITLFEDEYTEDAFESNVFSSPNQDNPDDLYEFDTRKPALGYFIALHPKFYYDEEGFDGKYFGFNLEYRRHNFKALGVTPQFGTSITYSSTYDLNEFESHMIYSLSWGSQTTNDKSVLNWYIAIGVRNISGERRNTGAYLTNINGGSNEFTSGAVLSDYKKSGLFIKFGFEIGLWWSQSKK